MKQTPFTRQLSSGVHIIVVKSRVTMLLVLISSKVECSSRFATVPLCKKKPHSIVDMPIYSPTGFLDITNATLRTSNTECQNLKIGTGNLYVTSEISPDYVLNLSNVTNLGATSPHTLTLSNVTTAIDATSNIITSGNLKIGGLIYTKDWGIRSASGSNDLYVGRFTVHGITEVLITDQGASLGSASKYTITRNVDSTPLVNGIDSSSTIDYQWYFTSHDSTTYDLWVRPSAAVQTNVKVTSSTYIEVDEPTGVTLIPCVNGLINMSGNVVANQNLTVSSNLTVSGNATVSTDLTVSGNTFYTSPVSINVDSNVVTEYTGPHDRPLRKYPEVALSITSESASGENGYKVSWSSIYDNGNNVNERPFRAFDGDIGNTGNAWMVPSGVYGSDGTYAQNPPRNLGTATGGNSTTVDGEYIILQTPNKIKVKHFRISDKSTFTGRAAEAGKLYGSNDGSTWYELASFSELIYYDGDYFNTVHVNATTYYDRLALVVTNSTATSSSTYMGIGELEYYGYEEGSGSLDTTLKTVYNVPATTGTQLEVYYDAKDLDNEALTSVSGLGGTTIGGTAYGDPQISNGAFVFDGTGDAIQTAATSFTGNAIFTASLWVKFDRVTDSTSQNVFFSIGYDGTRTQSGLRVNESTGKFRFYTQSGTGSLTTDVTAATNTWYHINLVHNGSSGYQLYINGEMVGETFTDDLNLASNSTVGLGAAFASSGTINSSTLPFKGSIANFRLYSKALNADQVKELYDYQKDYFFGSKSQVTLYKGHLGVGVTEPSGQLELAGDERLQEYPPRALTGYETLVEGHGVFCAYASTEQNANRLAWMAFNDESGETTSGSSGFWRSEYLNSTDGPYNASTGAYIANARLGSDTALGEYVVLQLPYKIQLRSVRMSPWYRPNQSDDYDLAEFPKNFTIYGSNDGNNWYSVFVSPSQTLTASSGSGATTETTSYSITSNEYYKYFGLVVTETNYGNYSAIGYATSIGDLQYFGTPGPTTLDKGSLTLGRSLDVPRVSRYDVDTETPRPEKLLVDFDTTVNSLPTDISGKGNHGTFGGSAYYSSADKAFILANNPAALNSASTHYIRAELNNSETGNQYHSVSLWFKVLSGQNSLWRAIFECGENPRSGNSDIGLYVQGGYDKLVFAHGGASTTTDTLTNLYFQWHHVVLTYDGANRKIYLDGTLIKTQATTTWAGVANMTLHIGRNNASAANEGCDCHVSNFKLYWTTALEASEVKKLYNLGRTGRSMVISDTSVGIGKTPEANLDVRGSLAVRGGNVMIGQADIQVRLATDSGYLSKIDGGSMFIANPSTNGGYEHFIMNNSTTGSHQTTYFSFRRNNGQIGSILTTNGSLISFNTGSDYRLKENIADMPDVGLEIINKLRPKTFNFKKYPGETVHGFIAHELQEHIPIAVSGEKDEMRGEEPMYQGVDASKIVPWLVKAIQELYEENQTLKTRLDALETSNVETQ